MASTSSRSACVLATLALGGLVAFLVVSSAADARVRGDAQRALPSKWVGTWRLVSETLVDHDGNPVGSIFEGTVGKLTYTRRGDVWALVSPPAGSGQGAAIWYTGTAEVRANARLVVHHVQYSSVADWAGTDLIRGFRFFEHGMGLRLSAEVTPELTDLLVWRKTRAVAVRAP